MRTISKALAVTMAVVAVAGMMSGCSIRLGVTGRSGKTAGYSSGNAEITENIKKLDIEWSSGEVEIVTGTGNSVVIEEDFVGNMDDDDRMQWAVEGTTLKIRFPHRIGIYFGDSSRKLTVTVPEDLGLDRLDLSCSSAEINIESISSREIDISSSSGKITAEFAGEVEEAELSSSSGDISAVFAGKVEEAEMSSSSGEVSMVFSKMPSELKVSTSSGSVTVGVPDDAEFTADISTASGETNIGIPVTIENREGVYVAGNGKAKIEISTASGDVDIVPPTILGK